MYIKLSVRTPEVSRNFLFVDQSMNTNDLDGVEDRIVLFDTENDQYNCFAQPDKSKHIPFKVTTDSQAATIHVNRKDIGLSEVDRYGCKSVDIGVIFSRSDEYTIEKIVVEPIACPDVTVNWTSEHDEGGQHHADEIDFCMVLLKGAVVFGIPGTHSGEIEATEIDVASIVDAGTIVFSIIDGFPVFECPDRGFSIVVRKSYIQFIFEGSVTKRNYTYHPNPNSTFDVPQWFIKILRKIWLSFFRTQVGRLLHQGKHIEVDRIFSDMIREED